MAKSFLARALYFYLFFLTSTSSHHLPRQYSTNQDQIAAINQSHQASSHAYANSTSDQSLSKRQAQSAIPNVGLDYSLNGMRQNGYFYTSKDFTDSIFDWTNIRSRWSSNINGVDLYLNSSIVYQEVDYGDAVTDSSAYLLLRIKDSNPQLYEDTMDVSILQRSLLTKSK